MTTVINVTSENRTEIFNKAYNGSYYTMSGCGGEISEWVNGMTDLMGQFSIGTPKEFIKFTGRDMNSEYKLTGTNAYPNDLVFLMVPLDGLDVKRLAIFKLRMADRWFDDIVDNNQRRETEIFAACN